MEKNSESVNTNNYFCSAALDEGKIKLSGIENLEGGPYLISQEAAYLNNLCILRNLSEGDLFFYKIEERHPLTKVALKRERGIGKIYKEGDTFYLDRVRPISKGFNENDSQEGRLQENSQPDFSEDNILFVKTHIPDSYKELYYKPHTIIINKECLCPTPLEVKENSLIGRLQDSIENIQGDQIHSILNSDFLSKEFTKDSSDLSSPSSAFSLNGKQSVIKANYLHLKGVNRRPTDKKIGQMIYNNKGYFEYWTGKEWRILVWSKNQ